MSKCARCGKTVYPTEELKCLDKLWHKGCFKCGECGMALNMKNYKGYNKQPYCNAHCPQAKPTTVCDTPEIRRLAENTRNQSQVKYHEDFEKAKGKVTQVADDPETMRIRNASKMISNVAYHGDLEKKRQMEDRRAFLPNESNAPEPAGILQQLQQHQQHLSNSVVYQHQHVLSPSSGSGRQGNGLKPIHVQNKQPLQQLQPQLQPHQQQQYQAQQAPQLPLSTNHGRIGHGGDQNQNHAARNVATSQPAYGGPPKAAADNLSYSSKPSTVTYNSTEQGQGSMIPVHDSPSRKIGSIADYDPLNHNYGSVATAGYRNEQYSYYVAPVQQPNQQVVQQQQSLGLASTPSMQVQQMRLTSSCNFRAIYDYSAAADDEVGFNDGDLIVNCVPIDEGWMTGTVQRTGLRGMLPSNYVQQMH